MKKYLIIIFVIVFSLFDLSGQNDVNRSICDFSVFCEVQEKNLVEKYIEACGLFNQYEYCYEDIIKYNYNPYSEETCYDPFNGENVLDHFCYIGGDCDTTTGEDFLDIYFPDGRIDNSQCLPRPIIVFLPSSYDGKAKMRRLCVSFASLGYITVAPSIREEISGCSMYDTNRRIYRGVQDIRAAVRYLRAHFMQYNLNPNRIVTADVANYFVYGNSSASTLACNLVLLDQEDVSSAINTTNPSLPDFEGDLDARGNTDPGFYIEPAGVILRTAMVSNLDIIGPDDLVPMLIFQGACDQRIVFDAKTLFDIYGGDNSLDDEGVTCHPGGCDETTDADSLMYGCHYISSLLSGPFEFYRFCGLPHALGTYYFPQINLLTQYFMIRVLTGKFTEQKDITVDHTILENPETSLPIGPAPNCYCSSIYGTLDPGYCVPAIDNTAQIITGVDPNTMKGEVLPDCIVVPCPSARNIIINTEVSELEIYPNPALNFIMIKMNNRPPGKYKWDIYSTRGESVMGSVKTVYKMEPDWKIQLPDNLSEGIYIFKMGDQHIKFCVLR